MQLLLPSILFLFSACVLGIFGWRLLDEFIGNIRPAKKYRSDRPRCWRCRKSFDGEARCPRCRATCQVIAVRAARHGAALAVGQNLGFGDYVEHAVDDQGSGRKVRFVSPTNIVIRPGDALRFVIDGRGRLRAVENASLATGWRLPTRAMGQRSGVAYFGWIFLVPGALGLMTAAPALFAVLSVKNAANRLSLVTGESLEGSALDLGTPSFSYLLYPILLSIVGGALLLVRAKPRLNPVPLEASASPR